MMMILILSSERLYREAVPAGELHGQYEYWHKGWHPLVNPDFCRLLDRGYDPHRIMQARSSKADADVWLSSMSNHADWLGATSDDKPDEPLNAPAALIRAHYALVESGRKEEADMLVQMVSLCDLYDSPWTRAARTEANEEDLERAIRRYAT